MSNHEVSKKTRLTPLVQAQSFTTFLCSLLAISMMLACVGVPFSTRAHAAGAQATLTKTGNISYSGGGWNTHVFKANDGNGDVMAYCVEPKKSSPPNGTYNVYPLSCPSGRDAELRADLWFIYGGPGFDASMWPSTNWNGTALSSQDYYLACHILLADTYSSSGYEATYGASDTMRNWIAWNILGFDINTGQVSNPNAVGRQCVARSGEVPANFDAYMLAGGGSQTIATYSFFRPYGKLKLSKKSTNPDVSDRNPNYTMKGIAYGVYTNESCSSGSDTNLRLVLDENGFAQLDEIRAGTYFIREIESSVQGKGYSYDPTVHPCTVASGETSWVKDASTRTDHVSDTPITKRIDVLLQKYDLLTQSPSPSGEADLSNAFFEMRYFANASGDASGNPTRTWTFKTDHQGKVDLSGEHPAAFISGDPLFYSSTERRVVFPLGTYAIQELTAPASYEPPLNADPVILTIDAAGSGIYDAESPLLPQEGVRFDETPTRHDLTFTKRDMDTQRPMANIPFLVSRLAQDGSLIEQHVAVTDGNGMFNSNARKASHCSMTNKNDEALISHGSGRYSIEEGKLNSDFGIWFGVAKDGSWIAPDDDFGAFPDSTTSKYLFEELPVKANEGKALVRFEAHAHAARSTTIDLGTVGNSSPTLATTACDAVDGDKTISMAPDACVIDSLSYTGLVAGQTYSLRAALFNAGTGMAMTTDDDFAIEAALDFTPTASSGSLEISLPFDATKVANGEKLVVCEELYEADRILAKHWDLLDSAQTITVVEPSIQTYASDQRDGDSVLIKDCSVTIADKVMYSGLVPGKEYELQGIVMDRASSAPLEVDGSYVSSTAIFTANDSSGTIDVCFDFDASGIEAAAELVVFETLLCNGEAIASHEDIDDIDQTVTVMAPHLETNASDPCDGDNVVAGDIESRITDTVSFTGLTPGQEYVLEGELVDKVTGRPFLDPFERPVRASHRFTPTESDGSTDVTFSFDASHIEAARQVVVFEALYRDERRLAEHVDLNSSTQSLLVEAPSITTYASVDGSSKSIMKDDNAVIIDAVSYENLQPGKEYVIEGMLMLRANGKPLLDGSRKPITASHAFTPTRPSGLEQVRFGFDATQCQENDEIVVFESLYRDGVLLASHEALDDARQTVKVSEPRISTSACSPDQTKTVVRDRETTIVDRIEFEGLAPDQEYEIQGVVMDTRTGEPLRDAQGNEISAHSSFVPEKADGSLSLSFCFDASPLENGHELVVFERLFRNGKLIAAHEDLSSQEQTVTVVPAHIVTFASDPADGDKVVAAHSRTSIVDSVFYRGLEPHAEYTLVGRLMNAETGDVFLTAQGNPAEVVRAFSPEGSSGTVDVVFSFDASDAVEERSAVIFEELYRDDTLIATHADFANAAQTVSIAPVAIDTFASDAGTGDKAILKGGRRDIIDTVAYTGLIPGKEYEIRGKLMLDNGTLDGTPLLDDFGMPCEARTSFAPSTTHGSIDVHFSVDTTTLSDNASIVVFETLYEGQAVIASHEDMQDEDQTVRIVANGQQMPPIALTEEEPPNQGPQVFTGDGTARLLLTCGIVGLSSLGILSVLRRKAFGPADLGE